MGWFLFFSTKTRFILNFMSFSNVEGDVNPKTDATLNPGDPETDVTLETSVSKLNESATPIVAKKSAPKQVAEEKPSDKVKLVSI